jgi:hypothetical protein
VIAFSSAARDALALRALLDYHPSAIRSSPMRGAAMAAVLFILSAIAVLVGLGFFSGAKSAVHEVEGLLAFTGGAILLSAACIVSAVNRVHDRLRRAFPITPQERMVAEYERKNESAD